MTLTELRYIVAVAREGHFGRAAEACHVSQPTLSLGVKKLEEELGVTLFERGHHEVVVTATGRKVVEQAARTLKEAKAVKDIARQPLAPLEGPLRIGSIHTVGPYLMPHLLPLMRERAPGMALIIEENITAALTQRLKNGELDVIIVSLPFDEHGIETRVLYEEPFVILLPASHPWTNEPAISIEELGTETVLLLGKGHCFREQVLQACPNCEAPTNDDNLQNALEGSSLETIRQMVAGGVGVTILPSMAAGADRYSQRLLAIRRFADVAPSRRVALAWRKTFSRPEAIEALAESIRACPISGVTLVDEAPKSGAVPLRRSVVG